MYGGSANFCPYSAWNMPLTVSSATTRRSVKGSKSTIQSSDSRKLRIIWEVNTVEHPCPRSPRWDTPRSRLLRRPTTDGAFRLRDHKPVTAFYRLLFMRHRAVRIAKGVRRQLRFSVRWITQKAL